jgi:hypothetical protein
MMNADHARALAMAYELSNLLHALAERQDNPRVEAALDLLDGILDELDTLAPDHGKQSPHSLRLLVTEPRQYDNHRTTQAMRHMATTPWRRP